MRTLIIDNYDSFTFNLVHQVADVTGARPVVIRNDEPGWTADELTGFDNVVISPGPGRPERPADFGICADVVRTSHLPLLGVCLGHQGICSSLGGEVSSAPEPVHGRLWPVVHGQVDVLAGLPSPFTAVRYHSLAVERLPDDLEAIGWTPDGVVMALRHRYRPMWGVQFHPESVCTEHGHQILRNFTELTRRWQAQQPDPGSVRKASPPSARPARASTRPTRRLRVAYRKLMLDVSAEHVFDACYRGSEHAFWLDSSLPGETSGRFSFMGDARGPLARVAIADVWEGRLTILSAAGTDVVTGSFLDWIDADLARHQVEAPDLPFDVPLGWVGYLGYELKAECGAARVHRSPHPDAAMVFADRVIAFDHVQHAVYALALADETSPTRTESWLRETANRLTDLAGVPPAPTPTAEVGAELGPLEPRADRADYLALVASCRRAITAGETYEVCLTNMVSADGKLDPWVAYQRLRRDNPAPFGALLQFGALSVLSCSPERFLRVDGAGRLESKPIKGTRPRGATPAEDELLRQDLQTSTKDLAENLMIVDLVRNDLGTCAEVGSVHVANLFDVETYPTVHQLVSTVRGQLQSDRSAVDCLRSAFPGGSMTGTPKLRTMAIIDDLEDGPRGIYSGALGYFSVCGAADFSIVIRTLVVEPDRVSFGVGGAVVALSDPIAEYEETTVKAAAVLRLLGRGTLEG